MILIIAKIAGMMFDPIIAILSIGSIFFVRKLEWPMVLLVAIAIALVSEGIIFALTKNYKFGTNIFFIIAASSIYLLGFRGLKLYYTKFIKSDDNTTTDL